MADKWLASRRWPQLGGASDERFVRAGGALLIMGGTASKRMEALAEQVEVAAAEGVAVQDMLVVCADPSAASRVRRRLRIAVGDGEARVPVLTGRELACSVMGEPRAAQAVGLAFSAGRPRLLAAYEADFVVEDVKTLGTRPKRLRELLKFLYRGWTELSDEDPEWLFTAEELDTYEFLADELAYLGAVMEPQLSNLATKALRLDVGLRDCFVKRRVFVLDYQNLSRASQLLCQLVAGEGLIAVADSAGYAEVHESYPYPQGVEDFSRLNPTACTVALDDVACEHGAATGEPAVAAAPRRRTLVWGTPADEIAGVADEIAAVVEQGCDPSDIAVMALHPWWARLMGRALDERGVSANVWYEPLALRGDIRDFDRCLALRIVTLLRLLADPRDAVAWRSWFGFGDYLTRSNLFAEMRKGRLTGLHPGDAESDEVHPSDARRDLEAFGYDLGSDLDPLLAEAGALRGPALLALLVETLAGKGAPVPPALAPLCTLGIDADASRMVAELDRRQFFDGIPDRPGVVVSSHGALAGLDFARAYAVGFVNGLFPRASFFDLTKVSINKQEKMRVQDERTAHTMARLAREDLCVSRFERAEHLFAERVGLKQARIFVADDGRTLLSQAEPSLYTDVLLQRAGEPGRDL